MDAIGLLCKAAAFTLAVAGGFSGEIRPTVWTAVRGAPVQENVFYRADAQRDASRWQAGHTADYDVTILTSDGGIVLDGAYEHALLIRMRLRGMSGSGTRYAIPYHAMGSQIEIAPVLLMRPGSCAYLDADAAGRIVEGLRREATTYSMPALHFVPPSAAEDRTCNPLQLAKRAPQGAMRRQSAQHTTKRLARCAA